MNAVDLQPGDLLGIGGPAAGCAIRPGRYLLIRVQTDWTCWAGQIALDVREISPTGKPVGDVRLAYVGIAGITVLSTAASRRTRVPRIPAQRRPPEPITRRKAS